MQNGRRKSSGSVLASVTISPSSETRSGPLAVAKFLLGKGASVVGHDPEAGATFARALPEVAIAAREYDAVKGADALVLMTEWRSYRAPNFAEIKKRMRGAVVVDARNVWRPAEVRRAGLKYQGVGVNPDATPPTGTAS